MQITGFAEREYAMVLGGSKREWLKGDIPKTTTDPRPGGSKREMLKSNIPKTTTDPRPGLGCAEQRGTARNSPDHTSITFGPLNLRFKTRIVGRGFGQEGR